MYALATLVYFELKYCERCAGLWLRPSGTATPYCPSCKRILAALPLRHRRPSRKLVRTVHACAALALPPAADDLAQLASVVP